MTSETEHITKSLAALTDALDEVSVSPNEPRQNIVRLVTAIAELQLAVETILREESHRRDSVGACYPGLREWFVERHADRHGPRL